MICNGIEIVLSDQTQGGFVDHKEIEQAINEVLKRQAKGATIHQFSLRTIENTLEQNVWISDAELYFDINNTLHVSINQRYPVARIIDNSGASYYVDSSYYKLPLSNAERADVPVFTGVSSSVSASNNAQLVGNIIAISIHIIRDSFWLAQASQIDVQNNRFVLYPAVGNYMIDFGDGSNSADKLHRLKLFYKNVAAKTGFDAWQNLSLVYDKQIVVTRKDSSASFIDEKKAVQVFDLIVKTNKRQAEAQNDDNEVVAKKSEQLQQEFLTQAKINDVDTASQKNKSSPPNAKASAGNDIPKAVMPKFKNN